MKRCIIIILLLFTISVFSEVKFFTLKESLKTAIENNLYLKSKKEEIRQAESEKNIAKSYFFPQITSSFTYTRLNEPEEVNIPPISFKIIDKNIYNSGLTLKQPLFTGYRITSNYKKSLINIKKNRFQFKEELQKITFEVKKAYFSVLKAKKMVNTAIQLKKMAEEHLKNTKEMFKEGVATKFDILKTEVFISQAEQKIVEAKNSLNITEANFKFLLNLPLSQKIELEDILEKKKELKPYSYWKEIALKNRPEIKRIENVIKIYEYNEKIERSKFYPQIYLFSDYKTQKGTQTSMNGWKNTWDAGITMEFDIWNWGRTKNRIKKINHQKKEMEIQKELLKNTIELEVKKAYLNIISADKNIETAKKTVEKAKENLRIANLLYREGMATTSDVLDAQVDLTVAKNNYFQSLYNYQIAYSELEKSIGKGAI